MASFIGVQPMSFQKAPPSEGHCVWFYYWHLKILKNFELGFELGFVSYVEGTAGHRHEQRLDVQYVCLPLCLQFHSLSHLHRAQEHRAPTGFPNLGVWHFLGTLHPCWIFYFLQVNKRGETQWRIGKSSI